MKKLQGAFTALITPMFEDGEIDYEGWRKLIQFQLEQGISGLVPLGTTGETPTLDETPEEDKLIEIVISEVKAYKEKLAAEGKPRDIPVILGCGSNDTSDAVKYVETVFPLIGLLLGMFSNLSLCSEASFNCA